MSIDRIIEKLRKIYEEKTRGGAGPVEALQEALSEVEDDFDVDVYTPAPNGAPARARIYYGGMVADCDAYPDELHCDLYDYD